MTLAKHNILLGYPLQSLKFNKTQQQTSLAKYTLVLKELEQAQPKQGQIVSQFEGTGWTQEQVCCCVGKVSTRRGCDGHHLNSEQLDNMSSPGDINSGEFASRTCGASSKTSDGSHFGVSDEAIAIYDNQIPRETVLQAQEEVVRLR